MFSVLNMYTNTCKYSRTCDGEIARAVGLSSVVLSKAGVHALVIVSGVEDLQTTIKHDANPKIEHNHLSYVA